jgi:hypothetical protein
MTEPSDTSPQTETPADVILRLDAIEVFGVTYAHEGSWKSPIQEILGFRHRDPDPFSRKTYFDTEQEALEHVRNLALAEAERELAEADTMLSDRKLMLRLWLARNWALVRRHTLGDLTTHAILANRRDTAQRILDQGPQVRFERMPDVMRMPAILEVGTDVWVFDARGFPERPVNIRKDIVAGITFHKHDDGVFDLVARYTIAETGGVFSYDRAGTDGDRLDGPPGQAEVFLTEERARARLAAFTEKVMTSLRGAEPYLMLPAPVMQPDVGPETAGEPAEQASPDPLGTPELSTAMIPVGDYRPVDGSAPQPDLGLLEDFLMSGLTIRRPRTMDPEQSLARIAADEAEDRTLRLPPPDSEAVAHGF